MNRGPELNILWLWPDILNLHGDRGNVMALMRVCSLYEIKTKITRITQLADSFDPREADIIVMGAGELAVMPDIAGALAKRFSELKEYADNAGLIFCTGASVSALGVHTARLDGSHIYGVGLFDIECAERETVLGDDIVFRPNACLDTGTDTPVCGIQIQMLDLRLPETLAPLGHTIYGYGNNGTGTEGAINEGLVHTNAMGPVLVKNPWLTLSLIRKAILLKRPDTAPGSLDFDPSRFAVELNSARAIQAFNKTKEKPK